MKWEKVKLGDVTESCLGKMLDQNKNKGDYCQYLANINVRWGEFDLDDLSQMRFEENEHERYGIKYGDLIVCEGGEPGRCAIWKEQLPNMMIQKALHRVRVHDCLDYQYLYYWFLLAGKTGTLEQYFSGTTTIKHLPAQKLKQVQIDLPPLNVQKRIASILSAYDDLIENNRKQIKLLEEAAQRLYREWFVDLRFPGYEDAKIVDGVPEGWTKGRADSFFNITIGKTPPRAEKQWFIDGNDESGTPWASISDMGESGMFIMNTSERLTTEAVKRYNIKIVPEGTILLSFKLTVGRVSIADRELATNEAIAHFYIEEDFMRPYLYCYLKEFHYDELGSTSSISKAVNSKMIKAMPIMMPAKYVVQKFSERAMPFLNMIREKKRANICARQARDFLLPKLMSGEVEAPYEIST